MASLDVLEDLRIASPCPASWAEMRGDDRVRFCDACSKNVYHLSELTAAEATALIQKTEGHLCLRLYRRRDGTLLTADCPVGVRSALRRRLLRLATGGVVLVATLQAAVWSLARREAGARPLPPWPAGPGVTLSDWADWAWMALRGPLPAPAGPVTAMGSPPAPAFVAGAVGGIGAFPPPAVAPVTPQGVCPPPPEESIPPQ